MPASDHESITCRDCVLLSQPPVWNDTSMHVATPTSKE